MTVFDGNLALLVFSMAALAVGSIEYVSIVHLIRKRTRLESNLDEAIHRSMDESTGYDVKQVEYPVSS